MLKHVYLVQQRISKTLQSIKMHLMKSPVELYIKKEKIQINDIKNLYFDAETEENKYNVLIELYQNITICQTVIFVNTITKACSLGHKLIHENFSVGIIHGKLSDYERTETLKKFRKTQTRVLVATDIIARGIDIQKVGLVINYDIPFGDNYQESYLHRIGRTGRFGRVGVAINLLTNNKKEWVNMKEIAKNYKIDMQILPTLEDVNYYLNGTNGYDHKDVENCEK